MADLFQFYSDTNQQVFEGELGDRGVRHERTREVGETRVLETADWIRDLAKDLGADCS